jgi:hypothetical protein
MMRETNLQFFGRVSLQLDGLMLKIDPRTGDIPAGEFHMAVAGECEG